MNFFIQIVAILVFLGVLLTPSASRIPPKVKAKVLKIKELNERLNEHKTASGKIALVNQDYGLAKKLYQSDIKVSDEDLKYLRTGISPNDELSKRNAVRNRYSIWRTRVIPYEYDPQIISTGTKNIEAAIQQFNANTCIKWRPKTASDTRYIKFIKGSGCWSWVGKLPGSAAQELSIGEGCDYVGVILHEMMHAAGFYHEQSRLDRDQYVIINFANIIAGMESQFEKQQVGAADSLGLDYDYRSLMHYEKKAFSKNLLPTIVSRNDPNQQLGRDHDFSPLDIAKLNKYYDCSSPASNAWSSWTSWGPCKLYSNINKCYKLRQRFCIQDSLSACPRANEYGVEDRYVQLTCPC